MSIDLYLNQIATASIHKFKDSLLASPAFMQAMTAAWEGGDKESVTYAREFEQIMHFTPVYFDDEDRVYIMVVDIVTSTNSSPVFKRGKHICGALKHEDGGHFRCLQPAGFGTPNNIGRCKHHLRKGDVEKLMSNLPKRGLGLAMREYMDINVDALKDEHLGSLDNEIRIMQFILYKLMESDDGLVIKVIPDLIERLRKLKETRKKMEVEDYSIDPKAMQYMIRTFKAVTKELIGPDMYLIWLDEIGNRVAVPTNKTMVKQLSDFNKPSIETGFTEVVKGQDDDTTEAG